MEAHRTGLRAGSESGQDLPKTISKSCSEGRAGFFLKCLGQREIHEGEAGGTEAAGSPGTERSSLVPITGQPPPAENLRQREKSMFERYTEKARRVIFFARYEASQFGSPYIE